MNNENIRGRHRAPGRHSPLNELKLLARESTKVMRLDDRLRVTPTPALFADLKQLLGPGCLG